jgi:hypothetical protein
MKEDERAAEAEPETPPVYEPPQLWEYGSLRIGTAGNDPGGSADNAKKFS